jgi:phage recombination protein Bet
VSNAAIIQRIPVSPLDFTNEQRKMILQSFLNGASEAEAAVLMELARVRRLNPITKQIHFVKRYDSQKRADVWAAQVGIDGFRAIAERTGLYDGQDEAEFEYEGKDGKLLKLCRVRVYRKDWSRPVVGVAHFSEYVQRTKDGGITHMWANKPHVMLAKCAEALAFRKGFPEDTAGIYAPEELGEEEREINPLPQANAPSSAANSHVSDVKSKLRMNIVDVQPGETEAEATARTKAPAPGDRIQALLREAGVPVAEWSAILRGATEKQRWIELEEADIEKVRDRVKEIQRAEKAFEESLAQGAAP